jgi:hypothetical protein
MPAAAVLIWLGALLFLGAVAASPAGRRAIAAAVADAAGWVMQTVVYIAPTVALSMADALIKAFEENRDLWARVVGIFVAELTGGELGPTQLEALQQGGPLSDAAGQIFAPLLDGIAAVIAPEHQLTPDDGARNLEGAFGLSSALALQGWWVEAVSSLVSLGRFGAAGDLPLAIERGAGLSRLGRLAWRTPVKKAIDEPLTEHYNRIYQFQKLPLGSAHQAWHRGLISDEQYLDTAAGYGYSYDRAAILLALARQPYSTAEVIDLSRYLQIPDSQAIDLLREQGFDADRAGTLLFLQQRRALQKVLDELVVQARHLYQTGRLDQAQLEGILTSAHYGQDEVGVILATEDLVRGVAKQLSVAELLQAYRDQVLDAPTVRDRLRQQGYDDVDVDVLLAMQHKQLSPSQVLDLFTRGKVSAEEASSRLVGLGYSQADAEQLLSLRTRRLSEGQVLDALRQGLINVQQATDDLGQLGWDPDQVQLLLAFQKRTLDPAMIQAAVARGLMVPEEALAKLQQLGYSLADAELIVDLKRRLLTVGQTLDAYGEGLLTRQDTLGDLQARGYSQDDALNLVALFELKKAPPPPAAGAAPAARPVAARRRRARAAPPPPPAAPAAPAGGP